MLLQSHLILLCAWSVRIRGDLYNIILYWWPGKAVIISFWWPVFHLFHLFKAKNHIYFILLCFQNKATLNFGKAGEKREVPIKTGTLHADRLQDYWNIMQIPHTLATSKDHCHRTAIFSYQGNTKYNFHVVYHGIGEVLHQVY